MRIDLKVRYEEKDEAKQLGARWDVVRKVWHLIDPPDLAPFAKWLGVKVQRVANERRSAAQAKAQRADPRNRKPASTPRTTHVRDDSLPACGCTHVAPWEHCEHSGELAILDPGQAEHMRAIASGR